MTLPRPRNGEVFGRGVVVVGDVGRSGNGKRLAALLCSPALGGCGARYESSISDLRRGNNQSCGCLASEARTRQADRRRTHGLTRHPLYDLWRHMLARCEDPGHPNFADYGGRGITVCPEWHDLVRFIADIEAEIGPRPPGRTPGGMAAWSLNRIDNDRGYKPGNVEWGDWSAQARSRRKNGRNLAQRQERYRRAADLRAAGLTVRQVATALDVAEGSVWGMARRGRA